MKRHRLKIELNVDPCNDHMRGEIDLEDVRLFLYWAPPFKDLKVGEKRALHGEDRNDPVGFVTLEEYDE